MLVDLHTCMYNIQRKFFIANFTMTLISPTGKFDSSLLKFKEKNIVIVFSNKFPNKSHLSKDRWRIFVISKDLEDIVEEATKCNKQEKIGRYKSEDSMSEDYCSD